MNSHPLVFFVSLPSRQSTLILEALKQKGFTVHCFDDISLTLSAVDPENPPNIIVFNRPVPGINTWNLFNALRRIAGSDGADLPAVVVLEDKVDPDFLARVTDLSPDSFLAMPVRPRDVADRAEMLLSKPYIVPLRRLVLMDDEGVLTNPHMEVLNNTGYQIVYSTPDRIAEDVQSEHQDCILITCRDRCQSLARRIEHIRNRMHRPLIALMLDPGGAVDLRELPMQSISLVVNNTIAPRDLAISIEKAITFSLMQRSLVDIMMTQRELVSREHLYRKVVDRQEDLLCKWRPGGILTFVNEAFCKQTNQTRRNLTGTSLLDYVPSEYHAGITDALDRIQQHRSVETYEHPFILGSNQIRWYQWTSQPLFDDDGNIDEILSDGRDMTERIQLELDLQRKNAEQELLLENIATQVWFLQPDGTYGRANRAHCEFLGRTEASLTGQALETVFSPQDVETMKTVISRAVDTREAADGESMITNGDGEQCLLELTVTPHLDPRGNMQFLVCSAQDITRRRMMEFSLAFRAEFEHLLSEISATFVQYVPEKLDAAIEDSLEQIGSFTGADRVFLVRCSGADHHVVKNYEWQSDVDGSSPDDFRELPVHYCRQLMELDQVHISSTEEIDTEAKNVPDSHLEYIRKYGIQSALYLPVKERGQLFGVIGLESVADVRNWDEEVRFLLKFYGELLLHTLQKKHTAEIIRTERDLGIQLSTAATLGHALELCLDHAIKISGMDCGGVYLIDEKTQDLELVTHKGLTEEFVHRNTHFQKTSKQYQTLQQGISLYFDRDHPLLQNENIRIESIKTIGVVPITYGNDIIACMNVASHTKSTIPRQSQVALEAMISRLGPAIAKARVEDRIRRNWENLDNLLNSIEEFLFVFEPDGRILHMNTAVAKTLGYADGELETLTIRQLFQSDGTASDGDVLEDLKRNAEMPGEPCLNSIVAASGACVPAETRVVFGDWLGSEAYFAVSHDLSVLREAEEKRLNMERQIQQARKVESLGRMAGAIAHRFNNLLMGVMGNLELAKIMLQNKRDPIEKIAMAEDTAQRATELSKLMLTYVGQGRSEQRYCNVSQAVTAVYPLVYSSIPDNITVTRDLAPDLPLVRVDANGLKQVILNLITNAWESMEGAAGDIRITTGIMAPERIRELNILEGELQGEAQCVYLAVTDTGTGMSPETIDKMFDPFFSTRFTGRGLGLSTVQGVVRTHEGLIAVDSVPDRGTVVTVLFPVDPDAEEMEKQHTDSLPRVRGSGEILLVDDEEMIRNIGKYMLEELGFSVLPAASGEEAVALFKSQANTVRCVLCDLTMPGFDGWAVLREIRRIDPDAAVILVSGYAVPQDEMPDGVRANAHLRKPFRLKELIQVLQKTGVL